MRKPRSRHFSGASFAFLFVLAVGTVAGISTITDEAHASVSVALTLDDLARDADAVARVTAVSSGSAWEEGRIVTTTRLRVDSVVAGSTLTSAAEIDVKTLGGTVGSVGQSVEGEPVFVKGQPAIVFVTKRRAAMAVVGRAQGHFAVVKKADEEIVRLRNVGAVVPRQVRAPVAPSKGRPVVELDGARVATFVQDAAAAWGARHAK